MKPAPPETAELLHRVRQQLILAQVRIMELEDGRDELGPKLADTEKLLAAAQTLADQKLDEAAHLAKVLAELQAQAVHLRHVQHGTNEALTAARSEIAALAAREAGLLSEVENLQTLTRQQAEASRQQLDRLSTLGAELHAVLGESVTRLERINQLDAEQRAMKGSRSWRWTSWLRAIERGLGGR
ncbi:MAG TPA: hypothetical protein VKC51_05450 [Lacunisphaera sp.]|nr:hypothetical protein [Lacunisphaera sp.]